MFFTSRGCQVTNITMSYDLPEINNISEWDDIIKHVEVIDGFKYEQRIQELEKQLEHHKSMSEQLQTVALVDDIPDKRKRKYTISDESLKQRNYVQNHIKDMNLANDLIAGVGLKDLKPETIPRSLMRAYVLFRYNTTSNNI